MAVKAPRVDAPGDPDFNDTLTEQGNTDPDGQEFRDQIDVTESVDSVGVVQGIDAEMREQDRQVQEDTLEVLEAMRALDATSTVKWKISRVGTGDPQLDGFLDTWPTKLVTLERIRDKMGGGTFYLKGFRNGKYWVHKTVEIAGVPKIYVRDVDASAVTAQPGGPGFDLGNFLAQQEARDAARRREEESRREREKKEADDKDEKRRRERNEMLALVIPAVSTLAGAMVTAFAGSRGPDIAALITAMKGPDPLTMLTQLKALQGNNDGGMQKILPMLIDMAGERASGGDTGWLDVVKELAKSAGPTIGGMIEMSVQKAAMSAPAPAPAMSVAPVESAISSPMIVLPEPRVRRDRLPVMGSSPVGSAASATGTAPGAMGPSSSMTPGGESNMLELMPLLPHLGWLKAQIQRWGTAATRNKDPQVYAALFIEELPEDVDVAVVGNLLSAPDWYQKLISIDSRLNREDLLPWFTNLRRQILQLIQVSPAGGNVPSGSTLPQGVPVPVAAPVKVKSTDVIHPTKPPSLTGD